MVQANTLARLPMASLIQTKELIMAPHRDAMLRAVRAENSALDVLRGAPANQEAMNAFLEKRDPDFSNL